MSFETAIYMLTEGNEKKDAGQDKKRDERSAKTFSLDNIELCKDMRRAIAYLSKTRGIDYDTIQKFIEEKYIFQESKTNNIIFPIYDEQRQIVGAEINGTLSDKRFKGIKSGSKYGYGFNIPISEPLKYALFFESALT